MVKLPFTILSLLGETFEVMKVEKLSPLRFARSTINRHLPGLSTCKGGVTMSRLRWVFGHFILLIVCTVLERYEWSILSENDFLRI